MSKSYVNTVGTINKGDTVTIKAQGITVTGTVLSAEHYEDSGWYIEMNNTNVPGGYSYYKQRYDGGEVVSVISVKKEEGKCPTIEIGGILPD